MLDPTKCRRLVVYGGSFDPPHRAHIELPFHAARQIGADGVLFIPAGQPPHKTDRTLSPAADRLTMLRLALGEREDAAVETFEIDHAGPSYTVDTLDYLHRRLGDGVELRLLIGADMAAIFYKWRDPRRIIELAEPLVMMREPYNVAALLATLPAELSQAQRAAWARRVVKGPAVGVSSSGLRAKLASGGEEAEVRAAIAPAVLRYIREHGLYGVR
jgi:nicotinate-nucleotide adenylyltransferase